jgi:competence ComEA-like helix-hairpin-helix protein
MTMRAACGLVLSLVCLSAAGMAMGPAVADSSTRADVLTAHADRQRTGWFSHEHKLTPSTVAGGRFGKLWESPELDGFEKYPARLYASPLYVDGLKIQTREHKGKTFRVVIAATSTGYVYAINATQANGVAPGAILWKTQLDAPCILRWDASAMGIVGTPVIDKARKHLYVVSCGAATSFRMYALDLSTGAVLDGWPVAIDEKTLNQPSINRNPRYGDTTAAPWRPGRFSIQRGALNLSPDDRYLFATIGQGRGWVVAVDTQTKTLASAFSSTPLTEDSIGGVWGSTGVSIDTRGNVYAVTGASGSQKHAPPLHNWAQSVLKFDPISASGLTLRGVYTPFNYCRTEAGDVDVGSSGAAILPDIDDKSVSEDPLIAVGGKQGNAYLVGQSSFKAPGDERRACSEDSDTDQSLLSPEPQPQFGKRGPLNIFGPYSDTEGMLDRAKNRATPAYFRNAAGGEYLFYSGNNKDPQDTQASVAPSLVRLQLQRKAGVDPYLRLDGRAMDFVLQNPGPPVVSSNGSQDAIVWVLDENARRSAILTGPKAPHPVLYAIDPDTLKVIWKSDPGLLQASGKYNSPTIADGNVYVGTDRIVAFGTGFVPSSASREATSTDRSRSSIIGSAAVPAPAVNQSDGLSQDRGKMAFQRACVGCHQIEVATRSRYTETGWRQMVNTMVERGAELSPPEIVDVTAYLSKNFGKVNVNTAAAAQLEEELGLTEQEAQAIVSYREQNGDIKSLDQLKSVPGVSPDKIQARAEAIAFRD